ncbi:MAG TPA: hypothetical protein DEF47_06455 [Herpetosiphon sp.]|uniref:Uncharacterized protein n=1 Tax=Herpetosiphon aurantiacus (strain ATCC 23779 / DSM 785 / 114-95) TaxID=316274 RepID=A9B6N7_HERA2|nr:hypothetical protein [Herpetosiphon sp.]ABX04346.1 hypothetical protein Haur_1703 [Herpetosiphon aurantiacus DSM 785]HBW49526.1 hypothetical protein [Herpetosiphon sp.]
MNVGVGRRILLWGVGVLMALVAAVPSAGYAAMPQSAFAVPGCSIVVNKPSVGTRKINNQSVSVVIGYVQVNCNTTQSQITINRTIQKSQGNQVLISYTAQPAYTCYQVKWCGAEVWYSYSSGTWQTFGSSSHTDYVIGSGTINL